MTSLTGVEGKSGGLSWDIDYTERMRPRLSATMDEYEKTYNGYYKRKAGRRPVKEKFELPKEGEAPVVDPGTSAPAKDQ